ncbi:MAG: ABC transporter ATP-binding protein [Chloroflexi bacterium]|nr:ABC transporter ATP-binding protein [Chloroflexota bacterium]
MDTGKKAAAVEVGRLAVSFGHFRALDGLDLRIPAGLSFGLLGPNGAGKTTLIRTLAGLLKPQSGQVRVLGQPPSPQVARNIGYMPQLPALYLELSALENVSFFAQVYGLIQGKARRAAMEEVLRLVGLWERRGDPVLRLSGGMRQRLSLACALVHRPKLLFLDEPTVGLDPELRSTFWEYFHDLTHQGATLVISSHTMDDASRCDELAFLRAGRVIAQGTPEELIRAVGKIGASLEDAFLYFARRREEESVTQ